MPDVHRVRLNLPAYCPGEAPDPKAPLITVDGVEVKGVLAISLQCAGGRFTQVTLTLIAEVEGEIDTQTSEPEGRSPGETVN